MITVAIMTYSPSINHPRHEYAMRTVSAALAHLKYEPGLAWHIADDGSPSMHVAAIAEQIHQTTGAWPTLSGSERRGYGASHNAMTAVVHRDDDDLVLCLEDDWVLLKDLDLNRLARAMALEPALQMVRFAYLGWAVEMRGKLVRSDAQTFLLFDPDTPEYHVFSAGPRLETVRHQRAMGLWMEHVSAGDAEIDASARRASREGVAWPLDVGASADLAYPTLFAHIGTESVKNEELA